MKALAPALLLAAALLAPSVADAGSRHGHDRGRGPYSHGYYRQHRPSYGYYGHRHRYPRPYYRPYYRPHRYYSAPYGYYGYGYPGYGYPGYAYGHGYYPPPPSYCPPRPRPRIGFWFGF